MNQTSEIRKHTSASIRRMSFGFRAWIPGVMISLVWALGFCLTPLSLPHEAFAEEPETTSVAQEQVEPDAVDTSDDEEMIEIFAESFNRDEKKGISIWTGQVRMKRPNGFLNADKVTMYENVETGEYVKTVAEKNVEIRDEDIFATCEHAIINHTDDTVDLRDNVVVLQNADRLEAKHFTFNRRTGKQTADGGVKFKVRMKREKKSEEPTSKDEE